MDFHNTFTSHLLLKWASKEQHAHVTFELMFFLNISAVNGWIFIILLFQAFLLKWTKQVLYAYGNCEMQFETTLFADKEQLQYRLTMYIQSDICMSWNSKENDINITEQIYLSNAY